MKMSDFVAEFRPKSFYYNFPSKQMPSEGFIASFGPTPKVSPTGSTGYLSPPPESHTSRHGSLNSPMALTPLSPYDSESWCSPSHGPCGGDYSNEDVLDIVSSKQLSKPLIKAVLERSILELTEKVLYGRSIGKIEGYMVITLSGDDEPVKIKLNKLHEDESDLEETTRVKDSEVRRMDSPRSMASDDWMGGLSPEMSLRADVRHASLSPGMYSPRTPSVDEREPNKTGAEVGEARVPDLKALLNEETQVVGVFSNGEGGSSHCHVANLRVPSITPGVQELSDRSQETDSQQKNLPRAYDVEEKDESMLVIDIDASEDAVGSVEMMDVEKSANSYRKEMSMESESDYCSTSTSSSSESFSDDTEDSDESKGADTEGPEAAPGDSGRSRDTSVTHPADSLVAQLPEGIMCKCCRLVLPDSKSVAKHAQEKHNVFCCDICLRTFTAKNNLKRHVRLHTGLRPYKCTECHQNFARRDDLKGHMLRHNYTKPFRCSLCQKGYTDKACVKNHMAREHGSRRLIVCPQCGESFDNEEGFSAHKISHPELQKFSCGECNFIGTNKLMTMKHKLIHTHKLFSCKPCNAHFPDPFNYTSHVRTHKKQSDFNVYTCCFCDIVLPSYEQFVRHEYSHAQGKTYVCNVCSKQFNSKLSLQEHTLSHKKENHQVDDQRIAEDTMSEEKANSNDKSEERSSGFQIPTIVLDEPEGSNDPCDGVLDLSIKKDPPSSEPLHREAEPQSVNGRSQVRGTQTLGVPRNGCAPGTPATGMEVSESQGLPAFSSVDHTRETIYRPVFRTNEDSAVSPSSLPTFNRLGSPRPFAPQRQNSTELSPSNGTSSRASFFVRSLSGHHGNNTIRFQPYKKNKIADFTSKFLAARGSQAGLLKKGRHVLKPVASEEKMNASSDRSRESQGWQNPDLHRLENEKRDCRPAVGLNQFQTSQIPTFIKSEPMFEGEVLPRSLSAELVSSNLGEDKLAKPFAPPTNRRVSQVCGQCKEEFASFSELESHSVTSHKRYLCEHCGKSFSARPNRDRHVRYHTGERPYKCDLCDQAFFRGDDLKYHRTTRHPTAQPFVCTRCSASFAWKKDLERHIRQSKCKL